MRLVKDLVKNWCPPVLLRWIKKLTGGDLLSFEGNYPSWAAAQQVSMGYDATEILQRVRDSTLKVKRGEALFERDSVCFHHEEYRWSTLVCLLTVAAKRDGRLNVLDFGGSLGSFYFQHRKFLSKLKTVSWAVVEQKQFVECGRDQIQDETVHFYESIDNCMAQKPVDVIFLSSVLQYLEHPYQLLTALAKAGAPYLLIDRTPFTEEAQDRLTVQHVPSVIYKASYPAWFFSQREFDETIEKLGYSMIVEFPCDEDAGIGKFKGAFFARV